MTRRRARWKLWVQVALAVLLTADAGLAIVKWRMNVAASQQQLEEQAVRLRAEVAAIRNNLRRAEDVRQKMPKIAGECDHFYNEQLLGPKQGYAALVANLGDIAQKAGLETSGLRFTQKGESHHGVTQVDATAVIEGNYDSLVRFIDGLEQSQNFYVLDSLQLASSTGGRVKLNIRLHTYFRT